MKVLNKTLDERSSEFFKVNAAFNDPNLESTFSASTTRLVGPDIFESNTQSSTVLGIEDQPTGLSETARKIVEELKSYFRIGANWNGEDATPPDEGNIKRAISFIRKADFDKLQLSFVAPGPDGEILVELKKEDKEAEVYFETDGATYVLIYQGEECIKEGELDTIYSELKTYFLTCQKDPVR